ncbi:ubiquinol-cytochrome c reductase cytochrome b subunit [Dactylosporangium fulvum]|uniref:Cytochrome bc1 complex cytochrome b subunit n=2 Tax=Dactylosporangium fulvum TaxID=53359 RepID=A0ABY5VTR8_9ACTN|nr:ubiquinol-cytochrome c reductase cytochrome b subunit [Dactylosporangium fulvum]UWP81157.1 ubiquinol-cytochrome c reductase cytochrome b subunit [Dactylosporangium fulvum]
MKRRKIDLRAMPANSAKALDERFQASTPLRRLLNKVFPDHWSFLLGEIALYSFIVLLLSGIFLALFFDPSLKETVYNGSYTPLRGVEMSNAYNTALHISFDVRGGLFMRQMHHWAALLFMAAIVVHMFRVFFTGAFRKPREANWIVGVLLFWMGFLEGFGGYSLPDDALSGTGLRIASAIMLSIPVVGTWVTTSLFGGEFPGEVILDRLYIVHVLLVPAALLALISVHMGLLVKQKHTQWPGPGRTNNNVVGVRMFPGFAAKAGGFFMIVFAMIALLAGLFQINPIWLFGPYKAAVVSAASQPDWYVMFLDGSTRLFPAWEIRFDFFYGDGYTIPAIFWPTVVLPGILTMLPIFYPFIEARFSKDRAIHNLLERPRDNPFRTALGAMAIAFYVVLLVSGGNDVLADKFHISLNAMTWAGRIGILVLPPLAYYVAYRVALGLQQHDREVLAHGVETGIIRRMPDGRFVEIHQPLPLPSGNGHGEDGHHGLEYGGWVVPKKMNRLGALAPTVKGFFYPIEKPAPAPRPAKRQVEEPSDREEITTGH